MLCSAKYRYAVILSGFIFFCTPTLYAGSGIPSQPFPAATIPISPQRTIASFAPAASFSSQIISEDTLWSGAIKIDGIITVAAQATLTIMPGTVIRFGTDSGILVLGRIVAKGSTELPITLTSQYSTPAPSDWYGIVLTGTAKKNIFEQLHMQGAKVALYARFSSFELKHLRVENSSVAIKLADAITSLRNLAISGCTSGLSSVKSEIDLESVAIDGGETGLSVTSSALTASKLKISSSSQAGFVAEKSQLKIENSVFSGNLTGAMIINCEGSLTNSKLIKNSDTAVTLSGSLLKFSSNMVSENKIGIQLVDNLPSIWGNSIYANSSYNLLYLGDDLLFAGGNWFGTGVVESLNKLLFSKRPNAVQILPLLTANPLIDQRKGF